MDDSQLELIKKNRRPHSKYKLLQPILDRFSPRVFSSIPIPPKDLNLIFEAARLAPSGRNNQPWQYFYAHKGSSGYEKIKSCLPDRNLVWAKSAPVLIVSCYRSSEPDGNPNKWCQYDLGQANFSLILQAQQLGYYSRQIGSFDCEKFAKDNNLPVDLIPLVTIVLGKIGTEDDYKAASLEIAEKDKQIWERRADICTELS